MYLPAARPHNGRVTLLPRCEADNGFFAVGPLPRRFGITVVLGGRAPLTVFAPTCPGVGTVGQAVTQRSGPTFRSACRTVRRRLVGPEGVDLARRMTSGPAEVHPADGGRVRVLSIGGRSGSGGDTSDTSVRLLGARGYRRLPGLAYRLSADLHVTPLLPHVRGGEEARSSWTGISWVADDVVRQRAWTS